MTSIISESSPSFLDHLHCSVCHRSFVASSHETSSYHHHDEGGQESFWIGECKHILCYKDLSRGDGPDANLLPNQIQGICVSCSQTVRWIRLRIDHLPEPVRHLLAPVETSMSMLTAAYEFQFKQMSDLITFLKAKTLEQKQVFESIRKEFRQFRNLKAELEEVRAENRTLKAKIIALQTPPLNHGGVAPPPKGVSQPTSGDGMGGGGSFLQPSGPFAFHQEQPRNQHHPHARASNGQVQATAPYDHDQHRYRSSTRPSTSYSDVFAYKPPPVPFREMAPTTRGPRTPVRERFRHQPSVPLIRPPYGPTKQEAGSMQRQSSKNLPGYQRSGHSGPSGETSQRKALGSRSFPTLCRDESQLRRSDKASSWSAPNPANFDLGAGPSPRGDASAVTRPGGGVSGSQDVAMPHEQHLKAEK